MIAALHKGTAPASPPAYHRAQRKRRPALHLDALTMVTCLHPLRLCHLAVCLSRRRCPPPLPEGRGGWPMRYTEESLLLLTLLRTLTYAALVVGSQAAQQAGRPDLIRWPKRVLAHRWEGLLA